MFANVDRSGRTTHLSSRSLRRGPGRSLALLLSILAGAVGCSSDGGAPSVEVGRADKADNGRISIDETKLAATVSGGTLNLQIPITAAQAFDASGSLEILVTDATNAKTLSTGAAAYSLHKGEKATLTASLTLPPDLARQADLVRFNLRLQDGSPTGLRVTRSLLYVVTPYEVRLEGPSTLSKGKSVSYRVTAQNPLSKKPLADTPVSVVLQKAGNTVQTFEGTTSATGDAVFPVKVDDVGDYQVSASSKAQAFQPEAKGAVTVESPGPKLLLTTDKPIYKPGQKMNLRALALSREERKPIAGASALFEIEDGKGTKIFKKAIKTDAYGIAATTFTLGQLVNEGTFKTRVSIGEDRSEKTVNVSQYALPKFDVAVKTEKTWYRPGETVIGTVDARYFFGKVVASGDVTIEASSIDVGQTVFQKVVGKLDDQGRYQFALALPSVLAGIPLEQGNASVALQDRGDRCSRPEGR